MPVNEILINVPGRLHSVASEHHLGGANEIYDDDLGRLQSDINAEALTDVIPILYDDLVTLRDNNGLIPGKQYRITDYVTHYIEEGAKSAKHQFDIIVVADTTNVLNEKARVLLHENDEYFADCNVESWEIWYCLDNDTTRFSFAVPDGGAVMINDVYCRWLIRYPSSDVEGAEYPYAWRIAKSSSTATYYSQSEILSIDDVVNIASDGTGDAYVVEEKCEKGKGVIYRMIDNLGNDLPYDFKNVLWKRYVCAKRSASGAIFLKSDYDEATKKYDKHFIRRKLYAFYTALGNNINTNYPYCVYYTIPSHVITLVDSGAEYCNNAGTVQTVDYTAKYRSLGYSYLKLSEEILWLYTFNSVTANNSTGKYTIEQDLETNKNNKFYGSVRQNIFGIGNENNTFNGTIEFNHFGDENANIIADGTFTYNIIRYNCHHNTFKKCSGIYCLSRSARIQYCKLQKMTECIVSYNTQTSIICDLELNHGNYICFDSYRVYRTKINFNNGNYVFLGDCDGSIITKTATNSFISLSSSVCCNISNSNVNLNGCNIASITASKMQAIFVTANCIASLNSNFNDVIYTIANIPVLNYGFINTIDNVDISVGLVYFKINYLYYINIISSLDQNYKYNIEFEGDIQGLNTNRKTIDILVPGHNTDDYKNKRTIYSTADTEVITV